MNCKIIKEDSCIKLEAKINDFIKDLSDCNISITSNEIMAGRTAFSKYIACITWK